MLSMVRSSWRSASSLVLARIVAAATNTVAHAIANDVARIWDTGLVLDLL